MSMAMDMAPVLDMELYEPYIVSVCVVVDLKWMI
jgi:hypothetical protein